MTAGFRPGGQGEREAAVTRGSGGKRRPGPGIDRLAIPLPDRPRRRQAGRYSASGPVLISRIPAAIHFRAGPAAAPFAAAGRAGLGVLFAHVGGLRPAGPARLALVAGSANWPGFPPPGGAWLGVMRPVGIAVLAAGHGTFK